MEWYLDVLKKYVVFEGRARRKEYWMFFLFNLIIAFVIGFAEGLLGAAGTVSTLYSLAIFLPSLAVTVRRLHDTDRSGWWILICLIPLVGPLVLLYFLVLEGVSQSNEYGDNPKLETAQLA